MRRIRISEQELDNFLNTLIRTNQKVILEENNIGRCENFVPVKINNLAPNVKSGEIIEVQIVKKEDDKLIAVAC
jgi:tRNA A37 methylthiotransferase MiaB